MAPDRAVFLSRVINILALFGLILVLAGSLHLQFGVGEQPCPLCIVQRSGMIGLAVGPMMNLLWGMSPRNYALSILAAVVGAAGSTRQILLHIADPNDPGYGPEVLGWHLYTWAFVTFLVGIVGCTMLILWQAPFRAGDSGVRTRPMSGRPPRHCRCGRSRRMGGGDVRGTHCRRHRGRGGAPLAHQGEGAGLGPALTVTVVAHGVDPGDVLPKSQQLLIGEVINVRAEFADDVLGDIAPMLFDVRR